MGPNESPPDGGSSVDEPIPGRAVVSFLDGPDGARWVSKTDTDATAGGWGDVTDEADRLVWLASHGAPVPEVVELRTVNRPTLVTCRLDGRPASSRPFRAQPERLVEVVARALRVWHDRLPIADCPFRSGWEEVRAEGNRRLAAGLVTVADLDPALRLADMGGLTDVLDAVDPAVVSTDAVVCHGDPTLPNLLLGPSGVVGWCDVGRSGVGSRWMDLMVLCRSVAANLGPMLVPPVLDHYGIDRPNAPAIDAYQLAWELL